MCWCRVVWFPVHEEEKKIGKRIALFVFANFFVCLILLLLVASGFIADIILVVVVVIKMSFKT